MSPRPDPRAISPRTRAPTPPPAARRRFAQWRGFAPLLLLGAVALAYANSLQVPFVLDDHPSIVDNASLRDLTSGAWLFPPSTGGETVSGRPLLNLSLAINYAWSGLAVWSYHLVNVLVHATAALLLFGIIRRTQARREANGSFASPAAADSGLALAVALCWALHPLQTAAVTYTVQRAESLAGLFVWLTLYAFIRHAHHPGGRRRWRGLAVAAAVLGMASKETASVAPLLVLLYDRTFVAGGFREAWRRHRSLYAGLGAAWLLLALLTWAQGGRGQSAGLDSPVDSWSYLCTQAEAIVHYLRLVLWPAPLVFDYGTPLAPGLVAVLPQALLVLSLLSATGVALYCRPVPGFLGASFFLLLAPSSSILPVATQTIAEHRMYLPLAPVLLLVFGAIATVLARRRAALRWVGIGCAVPLGALTYDRNAVYQSPVALWSHTVTHRPANARAHNNLGLAWREAGEPARARAAFQQALAWQPTHAFAHLNLASLALAEDDAAAALPHLEAAAQLAPTEVSAHVNLGHALTRLGRPAEAAAALTTALVLDPAAADARANLAGLLIRDQRFAEAEALLRAAPPTTAPPAETHYHWGSLHERSGDWSAAAAAYEAALARKPGWLEARLALAHLRTRLGELDAAEAAYQEVLRHDPTRIEAHYGLGNVHARRQQWMPAMQAYEAALALDPDHVGARNNLGNCQLAAGHYAAAIASYRRVLHARPDDAAVLRNLALAEELLRRAPDGR